MKQEMNAKMKLKIFISWVAVSLVACSSVYPPRDTSTLDKINQQLKQAAAAPKEKAAEQKLPDAVSSLLLPPIKRGAPRTSGRQLEQRFDLVVRDAPIDQVLMGIVSDTPYSIMLKPKSVIPGPPAAVAAATPAATGLVDKVTVNLKDVTVFEALDAIREIYGYDYTLEGNRIYVQPPELQTQLYQVNYIVGQRRGVSDMQVIGGASPSSNSSGSSSSSSSSSSGSGSGSGAGSSYTSVQASGLSSISKSDVWGEVEDTLRTTLGCQIPKNTPGKGAAGASSGSSSSSGTASASRADISFTGDMQSGERQRGVDGCTDGRAMSINQMSGTILVRGMPNEHRMIAKMLRAMQLNIERQVIIEAKIIDVELNSESQQGINWSAGQHGLHNISMGANTGKIVARTGMGSSPNNGGQLVAGSINSIAGSGGAPATTAEINPTTLGDLLGIGMGATGSAFASGMGLAVQTRNFSALINFLQTQGSVHVLSSPRIATLNNQKAVIKVGSEEPFVTNASGGQIAQGTGGSASTATGASITYQPFFSGIALDVTPQIDDKGNITLHVHSMVNSITTKDKLAIVGSSSVQDRTLPFAVNSINETDSVVKTNDGQVIVIGGLMTESSEDSRSKVPGAGDVPGAGALFRQGGQSKTKRELVILLKPTVVRDDSAWSNDIAATESRIENLGASQIK